ncbi:hypothetical protein ElyMa_006263800 [Elysia marginata]|uniref:Uncharacterized protein n=1 Tax=Elysia marginata TaxID=1093978 RepID=A0AAV4HA56_9GAST|nr:hypothetical protein ElyMa_006263800 [Elysia marginata]
MHQKRHGSIGHLLAPGDVSIPVNHIKTPDSTSCAGTVPQGKNLRKAQIVSAIQPDQEYLLHALTALAINSLTSDFTPREESERRLATVSQMSHTMTNKTKSQSEEGAKLDKLVCVPVSKSVSSGTFSNATLRLDEFFDTIEHNREKGVQNEDDELAHHTHDLGNEKVNNVDIKRSRVNQLRSYLRCSGFGEPTVIVSTGPQADQFRLARLLQRMRRNDNPERQERLRLRARLDYEMSLMRAVSFCEQQEQIFFRSASVDMENTDLQMLEDDLKYQAILEMRRNARKLSNEGYCDDGHKASDNRRAKRFNAIKTGTSLTQRDGCAPEDVADGGVQQPANTDALHDQANSRCNTRSGTSFDYSGCDIMSGVLGSPLSKAELRERIHNWLIGVANATAGSNVIHPDHDENHVKSISREIN